MEDGYYFSGVDEYTFIAQLERICAFLLKEIQQLETIYQELVKMLMKETHQITMIPSISQTLSKKNPLPFLMEHMTQ